MLNVWVSQQTLQPSGRVRIPYSPTFLQQVQKGNVTEISSTGSAIQGTFKTAVKYPSNSADRAALDPVLDPDPRRSPIRRSSRTCSRATA